MAENAKYSTGGIAMLIIAMILTGVMNTVVAKVMFSMPSWGENGQPEQFHKPWFGAWNMLSAMMLVGVINCVYGRVFSRKGSDVGSSEPLMGDNEPTQSVSSTPYFKKACIVAVPGMFDLTATGMLWIGLILIPASICNMLRGSCIVFSAIFSIMFLKDAKIYAYQWFGLAACTLGIVLVGAAQWLAGAGVTGSSTADIVFGMAMVIGAQVIQALQLVAEEWLMKEVDLPALEIVGWEGFWGCVAMAVIFYPVLYVMPGKDHGHMEDVVDTFYQLKNSTGVLICAVTYIFSCSTFNATGIAVTGALTAVHRIILVAISTLLIWITGLVVHQFDPTAEFGEVWNPTYSPLQAFGFFVLIIGQLIYGNMLKVPGFKYPNKNKQKALMSPSSQLNVILTPSCEQR